MKEQTRTFEGKDVDEAIEAAKRSLNAEMDEIDIRVLDHGNAKRFPFKRTKAKIAVSVNEAPDNHWEAWLDNEIKDQDLFDIQLPSDDKKPRMNTAGKAWIAEGQLQFHETAEKKPILVIPYDAEVYNHDEPISGRHVLRQNDNIHFNFETTMIETKWRVKVNDKEQTVTLTISPGRQITPYLHDHPAASVIDPEVRFDEQIDNELQAEHVYEQLAAIGIVEGIDDTAIQQACSTTEEQTVTIARGKLPKDGKNGEMAFRIDIQERSLPFKEKHDGTADFRESLYIPSVEQGEILAEIIDPLPGEDGISVYGEVLQAKDGEPVMIKTGKGVEVDEEKNVIIAALSGRPRIEQVGRMYRMSILPKKLHEGTLSIKHGNIRFIGDVEITGDVHEGMTVEAEGNVHIHKNVMHSTILSRQSVSIPGNAIVSTITAGKNQAVYDAIKDLLADFLFSYRSFITVMTQLTEAKKFRDVYNTEMGLGPMVRRLLEVKFPTVITAAKTLAAEIDQKYDLLDYRWKDFSGSLYQYIILFHRQTFITLDALEKIEQEAFELLGIAETTEASECSIQLGYAMNSKLFSTGELTITGKGAVHSDIHSEGEIDISGKLIGGKTYAAKGISIDTAGSPAGVKTQIEVPETETITIVEAHEDVILRIGRSQRKISEQESMICARLNSSGEIIID